MRDRYAAIVPSDEAVSVIQRLFDYPATLGHVPDSLSVLHVQISPDFGGSMPHLLSTQLLYIAQEIFSKPSNHGRK